MRWAYSFAPLRERNFAWFYAARVVNTAGSMMAGVALAFAILDISDSASALGQVLAARTIPMVVFLLWGGVIADRISRALILQVSNVLSAATQGAVAFLVLTGHAELWIIIVLEVVRHHVVGQLPGDGQRDAAAGPARPASRRPRKHDHRSEF